MTVQFENKLNQYQSRETKKQAKIKQKLNETANEMHTKQLS
jgi:hypothetical protein